MGGAEGGVNRTAVKRREPLSRDRVLRGGIDLADRDGLNAVSMRRLGVELDVEAMSLYNHVKNKADLIRAMLDLVLADLLAEVQPAGEAAPTCDWAAALRGRILVARRVMLRHRWVPALIETQDQIIPRLVAYYEDVLASLISGGFSYDLAHHTLHALGSRVLGFSQELFDPGRGSDADLPPDVVAAFVADFPHLAAMVGEAGHNDPESTLGWCDDQTEFEFGLDVLLDGLERRLAHDDGPGHGGYVPFNHDA